jgi:transposase
MTDKRNEPEIIDLDRQAADEIVQRVQASDLPERDRRIICAIFASYLFVVQLLQLKRISIARLKKFVFGARTEKTEALLGNAAPPATSAGADGPGDAGDTDTDTNAGQGGGAEGAAPGAPPKRRKGHGRNGADDFPGAERVAVPHPALQAGDDCPGCGQGTLYEKPPATLLRFVGQAPVQATVFELQRLRCHLCGQSFTAEPPPETAPPNAMPADAVDKKYDPSVAILIALLKYGRGLPFYRLSGLQNSLGIPLPPGTQWQLVEELARTLQPVYDELVRQAAQGQLLHHDDTANRILSLMGKRRAATLAASAGEGAPPGGAPPPTGQEAPPPGSQASLGPERTGIFTTGIVSVWEGHQAVLFFTGRQHAGENLQDVLRLRAEELEPPIQMCDALSRNMPAGLKTILANCLAHGRRQFVDVAEYFPQESLHVLLALKGVYHHDELARRDQLSPEERLKFHQIHSAPIMQSLQEWLQRQFDERLVEPNSALGKAISYLLRHWEPFTLFLRKAGAPLDNNICERALKKVILHRKNALFYKTENGASVGDLYMSLIHTCELGGFNPRDYFQQLVRHQRLLASNPEEWMPWNYRQTVASLSHPEPLPAAAVHET